MMVPIKCTAASPPLKEQYALNKNTCQIHCIYAIYGCKCSSKKYYIHWGMVGRNYFHETKKHSTLKKSFPFL